jgi:mono/diheme cytochrome c family protein
VRHALLAFTLAASAFGAPFGAFSVARAQPLEPAVDRGWGVAQRRCVACHAVRPGRDSTDGDAPPFTVLRLRYNELSLARRIASVTRGEHAGMPPTPLTSAERHDLVVYIESLGAESP